MENQIFTKVKSVANSIATNKYVVGFVSTAAVTAAVTAGAVVGTLLVNAVVEGVTGLLTKNEDPAVIIEAELPETNQE